MDFLHILENMKCNTRHSWTHTGRHESVAEHTFRVCCMAFLLEKEFPELDMGKVPMCLIHDWGEAVHRRHTEFPQDRARRGCGDVRPPRADRPSPGP